MALLYKWRSSISLFKSLTETYCRVKHRCGRLSGSGDRLLNTPSCALIAPMGSSEHCLIIDITLPALQPPVLKCRASIVPRSDAPLAMFAISYFYLNMQLSRLLLKSFEIFIFDESGHLIFPIALAFWNLETLHVTISRFRWPFTQP